MYLIGFECGKIIFNLKVPYSISLGGVVVSTLAAHVGDRGSIPCMGKYFYFYMQYFINFPVKLAICYFLFLTRLKTKFKVGK